MSIVNKLFSGIYNNINPITLSGVNDVIVVEDREGMLKCSAFQLRFGKVHFFGLQNQTVYLYINGKLSNITMSITSQGELFFEKSTITDSSINYDVLVEYANKLSESDLEIEVILSQKVSDLFCENCDNALEKKEQVNIPYKIVNNNLVKSLETRSETSSARANSEESLITDKTEEIKLNKRSNMEHNRLLESNGPSGIDEQPDVNTTTECSHEKDNTPKKYVYKINRYDITGRMIKNATTEAHSRDDYGSLDDSSTYDLKPRAVFSYSDFDDRKRLIRKIRVENLKKRMFVKQFIKSQSEENYITFISKHAKFSTLLHSAEHYDFLIRKYRQLLHLINGLINNPPNMGALCTSKSKDCPSVTINFSLCMDKKIDGDPNSVFDAFLVTEVKNSENLVVKIIGCSKCNFYFYMTYNVFSKIFFDLRMAQINKAQKIVEILENEHNSRVGWNLFGRKKILKREMSFSLTLNSEELKMLNLLPGKNEVVFKVSGINRKLESNIYLWKDTSRIIVSDIDGTITKSDVWGHLYGMMGKDWTHKGVASLYTKIVKNGYKIIYLTSRPLGQSFATKAYLRNVCQDGYKLPDGPVLCSPDGVFAAIYREIIIRRPEDFKIACLQNISDLFRDENPFVAGFGNKITDVITYKAMHIPLQRIFTINSKGELYGELIRTLASTYSSMNEFVDCFFPYLKRNSLPLVEHVYNEFSWWDSIGSDV